MLLGTVCLAKMSLSTHYASAKKGSKIFLSSLLFNATRKLMTEIYKPTKELSAPTIRLSHDDILARHQKHLIIIIIINMPNNITI